MRYAATFALLVVTLVAGCRSQSTPLTNPFLTPDRVPPPSTQTLAPGAAQPYYPGQTMPGTAPLAAGAPAYPQIPAAAAPPNTFVAPPGALPPASAYPGAGATYPGGTYPSSPPVTPTTPPLGGGVYPPQAKGESIGVPSDAQSMRFASATLTPQPSSASAFGDAAGAAGATSAQPAQFRTPIQSMLPVAGASNPSGADRAFTPNAGVQSPQQAAQLSGVTPAEYQAPVGTVKATAANGGAPAGAISAPAAADGFRPQGSQPRTAATSEPPSASGFRPPSIGNQTAGGDTPNARFGVGPQQEWLRGQLEFHPDGRWAINYMADGPKDQIGGRVQIENPQVLANLSPGEFVVVEGQLFGQQIDEASYQPVYRISSVQRQRQ
ncbi:MAG: hypothetical protein JNL18_08290 [Planctomycetaceae bacterium]|nr:hypothetical protein [Planctomycetaceae bacterium]